MNKRVEDAWIEMVRNKVFNDVFTVIKLHKHGVSVEHISQEVDLSKEQAIKLLNAINVNSE